ncbi:hypothetical protein SSBG_05063 [Streptomyces sp. SPB074]|nr:hypothetical protein SSBG_05063 [Streptomyces sp. SPB074]
MDGAAVVASGMAVAASGAEGAASGVAVPGPRPGAGVPFTVLMR